MSRWLRIARNVLVGIAILIVVVGIVLFVTVHTRAFKDYVRAQIISATADAVGGKGEIGSFNLDLSNLLVTIDNFVIHGNEPAGAAPFLRVRRIQARIRPFPGLQRLFTFASVEVDQPQANVFVLADGRTNVPAPAHTKPSGSPLSAVVDLQIGQFTLDNGTFIVDDHKQPIDIQGKNLRAHFTYSYLTSSYQGQLSIEPVYVVSGKRNPVNLTVTLPLRVSRNQIYIQNAVITTPASRLTINGTVTNLQNPNLDAHIAGRIAASDLQNISGVLPGAGRGKTPPEIRVDANVLLSKNVIRVSGLRATFGQSEIEASGILKNPSGNSTLAFRSQLVLDQLGRALDIQGNPTGTAKVEGNVTLDSANRYDLRGRIDAKNISFTEGGTRFTNVNLSSGLNLNPNGIELNNARLSALGGQFVGNIALPHFTRYEVKGKLSHLDFKTAMRALGQGTVPYTGYISGTLDASGSLKSPTTGPVEAQIHLSLESASLIVPFLRNFANFNVLYHPAYSGFRLVNATLVSYDLLDQSGSSALTDGSLLGLSGGTVEFTGGLEGTLSAPRIKGHFTARNFNLDGRHFDYLSADLIATRSSATVTNGTLRRSGMQARFSGTIGLRDWKPFPRGRLSAELSIQNADLADLLALAGQSTKGYSGTVTATAHISGTTGNPQGSANVQIANGTIDSEPFTLAEAQVSLTDRLVTIPSGFIQAPAGRVNFTVRFQHPADSFTTGQIRAHMQGGPIDLARIRSIKNSAGELRVDADVTGNLAKSGFTLTGVNTNLAAQNVRFEGQPYGDLNATARTVGRTVNYQLTSNFAGANIRANGRTELVPAYPTNADANISSFPLATLLTLAKAPQIPATGTLSASVHMTGPIRHLQAAGQVHLTRAVIYDQPIDRATAQVAWRENSLDVSQLQVVSGPSHINLTARYDHPAGNFLQGDLTFRIVDGHIDLANIHPLQNIRPGLGGTVQVSLAGSGRVTTAAPHIVLNDLNGTVAATGIATDGKSVGDLTLAVNTTAARQLHFALDSGLVGAAIHGQGDVQLSGDYPIQAEATFNNLLYTHFADLLGTATATQAIEIASDGRVSLNGPLLNLDQLNGSIELTRLNMTTIPRPGQAPGLSIANQGPVMATLDHGTLRIESAHLSGRGANLEATGTASLKSQTLDLTVRADADLGILASVDRDVYAAGKMVLTTAVTGTFSKPSLNGQLMLQNASLNYTGITNGLSNVNGLIVLSGTNAVIRTLTGESGGGSVTVSGFFAFSNAFRFGLRAHASGVNIRPQQGVGIVTSADLELAGTMDDSILSGSVTVDELIWNQQSDIGSFLARVAPPIESPTAPSPLLENMRLDVHISSAGGLGVQASIARNLQADVDLQVSGTAAQPGALGRVNVNEGQLVFFGSTYTVNTGSIGFYNPLRIAPILDLSLETTVQGVDVVLRVSGPVDNMKLSYTSNPPLQFTQIIALLAAGTTPVSDPVLLANQPQLPPQSYQQMGESALVSRALADPVSSRLERVFGVTQLKIDPTFQSGWTAPTARLTVQQRISDTLTFTYTSALNDPNGQIISVEWDFDPKWSALATRDQNGILTVNFFYKRQFR